MTEIIINADDYGLNRHCTDAIKECFSRKLITSTTVMATGMCFDQAIIIARENGFSDNVGIHFNLTEGKPLTAGAETSPLLCENGCFKGEFSRYKMLSTTDKMIVYNELTAQIEKLESCGIVPSHADSHNHIHTATFFAPIVAQVCKEHGIHKVRIHRNIGAIPLYKKVGKTAYNQWLHQSGFITTHYFGSMEDVEVNGLCDDLEIMVHPDYNKDGALIDRVDEQNGFPIGKSMKSICEGNNVKLISYGELP